MTKSTLVIAAALLSAGCGQATVSPTEADRILQPILGTRAPPQASEIHVSDQQIFNRSVSVRFRTTSADLDDFLRGSTRLSSNLTPDEPTVADGMSNDSWWRPDQLQSVRGGTSRWMAGSLHVDCRVMAGDDGGPGVVVYLLIVLEKHRAS
jgi:hypothetical protein